MNAKEIKNLRKKLGWTQRRLSTELDVAMSTIYRWESGESEPKGPALKLLLMLKEKADE